MARKHTAFYNIGFSEVRALFRQKLARKWGHEIARGWATLLLDRLRDFVVELELELIQTQMAQKPMLRAEVGMRVRCANKASAE